MDPDRIVLYGALVATTAAALVAGPRLGLRLQDVGRAAGRVLEAIGLAVIFFVANIAAGVAFVVAVRLTGTFVSVYALDDGVLALLSAAQAFLFQAWRMR